MKLFLTARYKAKSFSSIMGCQSHRRLFWKDKLSAYINISFWRRPAAKFPFSSVVPLDFSESVALTCYFFILSVPIFLRLPFLRFAGGVHSILRTWPYQLSCFIWTSSVIVTCTFMLSLFLTVCIHEIQIICPITTVSVASSFLSSLSRFVTI